MLLLPIHLMLATSLALLPSFLGGEQMDLLVNLVREEVEAMEERVREEVIKQMEQQMEKRELLLMAEMERLEKRLSPRREKRRHSEKQSQKKKTPQSDNSFSKVLQKTSKESLQYAQQTNQSVQDGHTNPQFNSSNVMNMTMMLNEQKFYLMNVISEREEAVEERLMTKSRRSLEELGARIGGLEEALMLNISDRGEKHKTWANYEIEKLNGRISTVAEDAKSAVDKIETVEKEIERMEGRRLVEKEMVEEKLRESKLLTEIGFKRTKELLEKEETSLRKELREMEMLMSTKMEASLIPLRSQVERALEEPPRLSSCAYQGAWNTTGTVTYSDTLLNHRCT